jgi:phospholipase/lecithinase/hemolysin
MSQLSRYKLRTQLTRVSGDSYSQTGFDITGAGPSASNPLGNPNLPGWTSSGGVNWISSLISEFNTSLVLSYNFAYGGATVDSDLIAPYDPSVKSLIDQVSEFSGSIAAGDDKVWNEEDALFGVWMGVNDVGNTFWLDDVETVLGNSVDRYFEQLQILYDAGARQFVVLTVPRKSPHLLCSLAIIDGVVM